MRYQISGYLVLNQLANWVLDTGVEGEGECEDNTGIASGVCMADDDDNEELSISGDGTAGDELLLILTGVTCPALPQL